MTANEVRVLAFLFGLGTAIGVAGMMAIPPFGRVGIFMFELAVVTIILVMLTQSHITRKALQQDDADENYKLSMWDRRTANRGAQVMFQAPRSQGYPLPNPYYYQGPISPQLGQQQPVPMMPLEDEVNV